MYLDKRIRPLPEEVRHYLAGQFAAVYSDLVDEAFPDLDRERKNIRIQTLIEGIIHSLIRLSSRDNAPTEDLLRQASEQLKELYPEDRHTLIDTLTEFIMPNLVERPAERTERGAA
ncbi:MAG: hypothetical protein MPW16_06350 [Candidatus Manganitrophus sp.]|nr:MAG: hypothetical protein MPW16_06350 [Candidatus Manganitrophus sp.]